MADEMNSIPPRVGSLEMEVHTVRHRLSVLEGLNINVTQPV